MAEEMNYTQTTDAPTTVIKQDGDITPMKPEDLPLGEDGLGRATRRYFFNTILGLKAILLSVVLKKLVNITES